MILLKASRGMRLEVRDQALEAWAGVEPSAPAPH
jgi:hypothetical protein